MLRSAITKGLGVGAAVAAAGPSTTQCRAQTAVKPSVSVNPGKVADEHWLFADFDEDGLAFHPAEVEDAINDVMALAAGPVRTVASNVIVTDMDSDTESIASSANEAMYQADRSLAAAMDARTQFAGLLNTMLANPNVQRECMNALRGDPNFSRLLEDVHTGGYHGSSIAMDSMLRDAADSAAAAMGEGDADGGSSGKNPLQQLVDAIGEGLQHLGHKVTKGWNAVGDMLISLGFQLHSLLRRSFANQNTATRVGENSGADTAANPQQWLTKVLMYVGCAVMALLVMRRVGRVSCTRRSSPIPG